MADDVVGDRTVTRGDVTELQAAAQRVRNFAILWRGLRNRTDTIYGLGIPSEQTLLLASDLELLAEAVLR